MIPYVSFKTGKAMRRPKDGWKLADPFPMGQRTRTVFRALIRAICPVDPTLPEMIDRIEVHARRLMRYMNPLMARGMMLAMHVLNWSPIWMGKNTRCLKTLPREKGETHLDRMAESGNSFYRLLLLGVRSTVLSIYFDQPEVHKKLNYAPGAFVRKQIARREMSV